VLEAFPGLYRRALLRGQRAKLGLDDAGPAAADEAGDAALAEAWLELLHAGRIDFTLAWRRLADAAAGDEAPLRALFADAPASLEPWLARWRERVGREAANPGSGEMRAARMRRVNPIVIARNHRVEEALAAASNDDDLGPFEGLLAALRQPYDEIAGHARYAEPAPAEVTACYRTFCGT
jgi:uncharacterized protein YdiU (UPF0061 family)